MASVHFWTEAPESFIAATYCGVEAIKLSGRVLNKFFDIYKKDDLQFIKYFEI